MDEQMREQILRMLNKKLTEKKRPLRTGANRSTSNTDSSSDKPAADTTYRDEPIIFTANQLKNYAPPEYKQLDEFTKKFNSTHGNYSYADRTLFKVGGALFYAQAKFMENFEDNVAYNTQIYLSTGNRSHLTYDALDRAQLRGYFSWRTDMRHNRIYKAPLEYLYLYVTELLNQIGSSTPEEGLIKLIQAIEAYRRVDDGAATSLERYIDQYIIYHNLNSSQLYRYNKSEEEYNFSLLSRFAEYSPMETLSALEHYSAYNVTSSKFYEKFPLETADAIYTFYTLLADYLQEKNANGVLPPTIVSTASNIVELLFGRYSRYTSDFFSGLAFYEASPHEDCTYIINACHSFICRNGKWQHKRLIFNKDARKLMGTLLKAIDFSLRQRFHFKSTLKQPKVDAFFVSFIEAAVADSYAKKIERERPRIHIDVSKLQTIRDTAKLTQDKLIVEDLSSSDVTDNSIFTDSSAITATSDSMSTTVGEATPARDTTFAVDTTSTGDITFAGDATSAGTTTVADLASPLVATTESHLPINVTESAVLNSVEQCFLRALLTDSDYRALLREQGLPDSVVIDTINEKLFDFFSDTLIIYDGDRPVIVEDYIEDLKGLLKS